MEAKLPQITPEQIYVSRIAHHWVVNDAGWGRMEPVDKTIPPTGSILMDAIARILARTHITEAREVAALLHASPADLRGAVRILTGMTLAEFILRYRLLEACELLAKTNLSISEIAQRMRKSDSVAFYKMMQTHCKCSPTDYRRRHRARNYRQLYRL